MNQDHSVPQARHVREALFVPPPQCLAGAPDLVSSPPAGIRVQPVIFDREFRDHSGNVPPSIVGFHSGDPFQPLCPNREGLERLAVVFRFPFPPESFIDPLFAGGVCFLEGIPTLQFNFWSSAKWGTPTWGLLFFIYSGVR